MMRCDHYLWKKQNHSQSLVRLSFICLFHQFTLMFPIALQYDTKIHHLLLQPEITYGRNDKVVTNWQSMKAKKALRFAYSVVSHRMILLVMQRSIAKPWTEMCESTANALSIIDIECPARILFRFIFSTMLRQPETHWTSIFFSYEYIWTTKTDRLICRIYFLYCVMLELPTNTINHDKSAIFCFSFSSLSPFFCLIFNNIRVHKAKSAF